MHRVVLWTLLGLSLLTIGAVASPFILNTALPSPQDFRVLPVPLAANPGVPDRWDFSNPHPILHPGDSLVAAFTVCYSDIFGGGQVLVDSNRQLVSQDRRTKAVLRHATLHFGVGCRVTNTTLDVMPVVPSGVYRVEADTYASTPFYSHRTAWQSVYFTLEDSL